MKKTILAAIAVLCALAFPVAAAAKSGHGEDHPQGHGEHAVPEHVAGHVEGQDDAQQPTADQTTDDQGQADQTPAAEHRGRGASRRCKRAQSVGFVVKGSLASFTPETVTLDVKRANRHARSYIKTAGSTFTLGTARVKFAGVTDADGSGTVDFADVLPTDQVVAVGKATRPKRGCKGDTVLKLRKLQVVRPDADESESETEIE